VKAIGKACSLFSTLVVLASLAAAEPPGGGAAQPPAPKTRALLKNGEYLAVGESLVNGDANVRLKANGDLCVARGNRPLWCALEVPTVEGKFFAIMQGDGNLCIYRGEDPAHKGARVWCAMAAAPGEARYFAAVQPDYKFCIHHGDPPNGSATIWCNRAAVKAGAPAGHPPANPHPPH
jgi:hypothetical protein